jgi:beta-glucosidase
MMGINRKITQKRLCFRIRRPVCINVAGAVAGLTLILALTLFVQYPLLAGTANGPGHDPAIEKKIDSLISLMTPDEKLGQLNQVSGDWDEKKHESILSPELHELLRRGGVGSFLNITGAEQTRKFQKIAVEESRLHIPLIFGLDVIHGYRTTFPIPLGEACAWDPAATEKAARIAANEASANGINWTFAPMVDIARDPRWGRIAEGSGEDPYLGSVLASARVRGFQTNDIRDTTAIVACAKHFAAYGGAEGGRDYNTVELSERTLREVYLRPFKSAVEAGAGTLMSAFNEINGEPSSANRWLLTSVLRDEWNFKGFVVSDWGAIAELLNHGIADDGGIAGAKALKAGVDMDMMGNIYINKFPDLLRKGILSSSVLDEAVRRVLRVKYWAGLFENPYKNCQEDRAQSSVKNPDNLNFARIYAEKSIVLLKNDNHILPLSTGGGKLAVIGWLAQSRHDPLGPWSCEGRDEDVVTILAGIQNRSHDTSKILFAPGYDESFNDSSGFHEAIRVANQADKIIVVAGEHEGMSGEAASRADIGLPGVQTELIKQLAALGKPVVLVLMNGRPLAIPWEAEHVTAIVESWFGGIEMGNAVAAVLFGDVNPSGKLAATFPRSTGQIPIYYNHKNTGRPANPTNHFTSKYLDLPTGGLFPFGFGLSYTTYEYGKVQTTKTTISPNDTLYVSVGISNTGARSGDEIVQMYIHDESASVTRPVKELKGFSRVHLEAGERKLIEFPITVTDLSFYKENMDYGWEPGKFTVMIGPNSEQTQEIEFELRAK